MGSDRHLALLAGRVLDEGEGFPEVVVVDEPIKDVFGRLGLGREELPSRELVRLFWYFYDGPFSLTLTGEDCDERGAMRVRGILLSGEGAPPTRMGVSIGDPIEKVRKVYGEPDPWTTTFGSPATTIRALQQPDGAIVELQDPDAPFRASLYYPDLMTFFVPRDGKVSQIGLVASDNPVAIFLRPEVRACIGAREDASLREAQYLPDPSLPPPPGIPGAIPLALRFPPIPELVTLDYKGLGRIVVPRDWVRPRQGLWVDPHGNGSVAVHYLAPPEAGKTLRATLANIEAMVGGNHLLSAQRVVPTEFLQLTGADEAYAVLVNASGRRDTSGQRDAEEVPIRIFMLLVRKGALQYNVAVTRLVASPNAPSPDGVALTSRIMRGLRFTSV